jgi:hypothetical protein
VHDHLFRPGVPPTAQGESRARRRRRWHPDLDAGEAPADLSPLEADVAVDFVDATLVVDRMHAAFFRTRT